MTDRENVQTYYIIYSSIRDKPRYNLKTVAKTLGMSGRGHSYTTASNYIKKLYQREISLRPNLVLKNYENCFTTAYFLKVDDPKKITPMFLNLSNLAETRQISYMLLLAGRYDFFVTSKYDLSFEEGLTVEKKSILYNPIYTHPSGWRLEMEDAFKRIADSDLKKGTLQRDIEDFLYWGSTEFRIFETMKNNVQMSFTKVAKICNFSPNTVRKYFCNEILPCCDIAHYFFPKGYDHYHKSLIIMKTDYEEHFVKSLTRLPCTSYVFPLEEEIVVIIFHDGVDDLMYSLKKLEEKGYIKYHLLLVPLHWD